MKCSLESGRIFKKLLGFISRDGGKDTATVTPS